MEILRLIGGFLAVIAIITTIAIMIDSSIIAVVAMGYTLLATIVTASVVGLVLIAKAIRN